MTRVASPSQVVTATLRLPHLQIPHRWPDLTLEKNSCSIQDLAWEVLACIHKTPSPVVLFHVFSNGGCFVWEQIRRIFDQKEIQEHSGERISSDLSRIQARVRGVVFDSCPGADLERIGQAMEYCTWQERMQVLASSCGVDYLFLNHGSIQEKLRSRGQCYMEYLRSDPRRMPQLYLYSGDDPLARAHAIDELIANRKKLIGDNLIWKRRWDSSPHCSHIIKHTEEYNDAVNSFLEFCIGGGISRSRL